MSKKNGFLGIKIQKWETRDLLIIAVISLIFASVLVPVSFAFIAFIRPLGIFAQTAGSGIWFIPAIFVGYVFRRPGAVVLSQLMIRIMLVPLSPYGWMEIAGLIVVGLPIELTFLLNRYRRYKLVVLIAASVFAGLVRLVAAYVPYGISQLSYTSQLVDLGIIILSNVLAAVIAKGMADSIAKAGVFDTYEISEKYREEI